MSKSIRFAALVGLAVWLPWPAEALAENLSGFVAKFAADYPAIRHEAPAAIEALRAANPASVVILDTREPAEYAVSHLPGAVRVDPSASAEAVLAAAGDVTGKPVVFYCSVGYRSSRLATQAREALLAKGAKEVMNVRGGIFGWHNSGLPLENEQGTTRAVHPYSSSMTKYLADKSSARTAP